MKNFQINKEYRILRCDVCHQSDMFDVATNWCNRCEDSALKVMKLREETFVKITREAVVGVFTGLMKLGTVSGLIVGVIFFFFWMIAPNTDETFLVLTVVSLFGGPLSALFSGMFFSTIALLINWIEEFRWQRSGKKALMLRIR
ncbi:MAG: hypothetical protein JNN15_18800 [Blastocatellia bacterium]|nr:hypothetical protein [Blastocatellia bacterium]